MTGESESFAAELRGFGPVGIIAALVIVFSRIITIGPVVVPLGGLLAVAWARWSHTPWREIGYVRPRSWIGGIAVGLAFGFVLKMAVKAIVMPLLGAPPTNAAYHYLAGNRGALPTAMLLMLAAGFGEETVFRGFLFERFGKLFGSSAGAKTSIVLLTAALFAAGHYADQGLAGVEQAVCTGLVFGGIFAVTGRIWMLMWAHAAYDLAALALIYLDLETTVAHAIFK